MYKVLFAEDELLVRLGLQNSIPWEKYDMELQYSEMEQRQGVIL